MSQPNLLYRVVGEEKMASTLFLIPNPDSVFHCHLATTAIPATYNFLTSSLISSSLSTVDCKCSEQPLDLYGTLHMIGMTQVLHSCRQSN